MSDAPLWSIFVNAALVNNFVLAYFLGICPFFGVSARPDLSARRPRLWSESTIGSSSADQSAAGGWTSG